MQHQSDDSCPVCATADIICGKWTILVIRDLADGRTIIVPLAWYPRLLHATPEQRANWQVAGAGFGIHWPEIDEDLSTDGLLRGLRAPRGSFTAA